MSECPQSSNCADGDHGDEQHGSVEHHHRLPGYQACSLRFKVIELTSLPLVTYMLKSPKVIHQVGE
jgi:hypothetical protein